MVFILRQLSFKDRKSVVAYTSEAEDMLKLQFIMEKFCVEFNDFQTSVSKSFRKLRHEEEYSDVTLMGEDYQPLQAHRIILSSCSEYFKNVLCNSKTRSDPVLCLEGLMQSDLTNVLDFIYNGELQLYSDDLERFVKIAQRLKLEGLTGQDEKEEIEVKPLIGNTEDLDPIGTSDDEAELTDVSNCISSKVKTEKQETKKVILQSEGLDAQELGKKLDELFTVDNSGIYTCKYCSRASNKKSNMREHAEVHVDGLSFSCDICSKSYRSHSALRRHNGRKHGSGL